MNVIVHVVDMCTWHAMNTSYLYMQPL